MGMEKLDGPLIEKGEEPVGDFFFGDVDNGDSRELVVHYVEGVEARRRGLGKGQEAARLARSAKRWSMLAAGFSLVALAVAVIAYVRP
jgi:hypothetical protein